MHKHMYTYRKASGPTRQFVHLFEFEYLRTATPTEPVSFLQQPKKPVCIVLSIVSTKIECVLQVCAIRSEAAVKLQPQD